ncbi:hypothetical protein E2C01_073976 [Portunus trituberculatus]|uniref:Uncharacterized protein n=1 Tax=Portunus trituberculatus TaxID=210409 RepID=A0A5B7IF40_PORTR|nr:hypothetical protein [Portunus trituberculatus]
MFCAKSWYTLERVVAARSLAHTSAINMTPAVFRPNLDTDARNVCFPLPHLKSNSREERQLETQARNPSMLQSASLGNKTGHPEEGNVACLFTDQGTIDLP